MHFKCSGTDNWGKARQALDMIAAAKARGLEGKYLIALLNTTGQPVLAQLKKKGK